MPGVASLAAALQVAGCPVGFAPPLDRPLTVVTIDERELNGMRHVFTQRRTIVFRRDGAGLRATLTQQGVVADAAPDVARRLSAAAAALNGVPVDFAVAADGCTAQAVDPAALRLAIRRAATAMVAAAGDAAARDQTARLLAPLLAIDDAAMAAMAVAMIRPLLPGGVDVRPGPAGRTAVSPLGGAVPLVGERSVTAHGGATHVATRLASRAGEAAAALAQRRRQVMAAPSAGGADMTMTVRIAQTIEEKTRLVVETRTETDLRGAGADGPAHRIVSTTRIGGIGSAIGR